MTATKVIRIDPEVYEALRAKGKAFETPNDVLRRLIFGEKKSKEKAS